MYGDASVTYGWAGGDMFDGDGWDKKTGFDVEGRVFWEFMDDVTVVPYFGYTMADYSLEGEAAPTGDKASQIALGASLNFDVNTNNLLIFAVEWENFNWKYSKEAPDNAEEVKATVLPRFTLALESDITSWFTARVGATKTMIKWTFVDEDGTETKITDAEWVLGMMEPETFSSFDPLADDFQWYLGGGFHVGEWDIDAVFSHEVPFRLGYWLTGYGTDNTEPPVGRVSATYRF
jgi:hypothetical protein